jgi:arsenate reductase-like glutaredoxin family protein
LARVRLEGPFANRALLGFGWADVERGAYQSALAPWQTLSEREPTDPAVQEALLAVPYALAKLDVPGRAAQRYEAAIGGFLEQAASLEEAIAEIHRGALLALLGSALQGADGGWFWELSDVPPSPLTRNLSELLASHGFQEALRNYRDLRFLQQNLDAWAQSVGSFEEMLATRRARYERVLPETQAYLAAMDVDALRARLTRLQQALRQARAKDDGKALATAQELDQLARLAEISTRIQALGEHPALEEVRTRQRFLQGVLDWELQAAAPARLWELEKSAREVQAALEETDRGIASLEQAQDAALIGFEGYADRIAAARSRIDALRPEVAEVLAAQETRLESLAIDALRARQRRLKTYAVQARFSLAQIYDQVASDGESEP